MAVALLSLLGLLVSLYLLIHAFGLLGPIICGVGDCQTVQASPWAKVGPVPVPAIGVMGYGALLAVALAGLRSGVEGGRLVPTLLLLGSGAGTAFSAYLTYLEAFVIEAWCQWCVGSAILVTLAFVASLPEIARLRGGR